MDLAELVNIGETNTEYSALATLIFKRNFGHKTIYIAASRAVYDENDDDISIYDLDLAIKVIKRYGEHIVSLRFRNVNDRTNLMNHIIGDSSMYCKNLQRISIRSDRQTSLNNIQKPFNKVNCATFSGEFFKIGNDQFNLTEMFPQIKRLHFANLRVSNSATMDSHIIPNLKCMHLDMYMGPYADIYMNMIKLNPQIREITLLMAPLRFIHFVNQHVPNLKELVLYNPLLMNHNDNQEIYFKNVHKFRLGYNTNNIQNLGGFRFKRLTELICDPSYFSGWLNFIAMNPSLEKLQLKISSENEITDEELLMMSNLVPNLVEASFDCNTSVKVESLVQFLEDNKHLKLWKFSYDRLSQTKIDQIIERINHKWEISRQANYYIIQRI